MALSSIDRELIQRCLARQPRSWEDFVDRFLGLVVHVVNHTAQSRSMSLSDEDREDLAAEVFVAIIEGDFAVLRRFRGDSSLATYLTVIARRVVVRELLKRRAALRLEPEAVGDENGAPTHEDRINDREELEQLLLQLDGQEAEVVRLYHLDGKSYREISDSVGIAENSVGPMLSRAREKMRKAAGPAS